MPYLGVLVLQVVLVILRGGQGSLLQDTLKKETVRTDENDGIKVDVVSDDSNDQENKETTNDQGDHIEEQEPDTNATIELETIYKPHNCSSATKSGKLAVLHYTGWVNKKQFDTTIDPLKRYMPFEFLLGTGAVIKGFEQGLKEMCKGEQRRMVIPPELGYGSKATGLIPGNATLEYEVQLLDVRDPPPQADVFTAMDGDGDKKLSRDEVSEYMKKQAQMHYGAPMDDVYWNNYHNQMVDNIFHQDDEDEDGTISHEEFSGPKVYHEEL